MQQNKVLVKKQMPSRTLLWLTPCLHRRTSAAILHMCGRCLQRVGMLSASCAHFGTARHQDGMAMVHAHPVHGRVVINGSDRWLQKERLACMLQHLSMRGCVPHGPCMPAGHASEWERSYHCPSSTHQQCHVPYRVDVSHPPQKVHECHPCAYATFTAS